MNAEKLVREMLRMKLRAGGKLGEYALYVSPSGVKVALASDYNLAMLAGMKDFWEWVPECKTAPEPLPPFDDETDPHHCKRCFTCVFDGHGKTYVSGGTHTVPEGYTCTVATPKEIRDVIDHAKSKAERGNDSRSPLGNGLCIHARHYTISPETADDLKRELMLFGNQHSYNFTTTVLKLIENARG